MFDEELAKDKGANVGNGDVISRCELENCQTSLSKVLFTMTEMRTSLFAEFNGLVKCTFPTRYCHRKSWRHSDVCTVSRRLSGRINFKFQTNQLSVDIDIRTAADIASVLHKLIQDFSCGVVLSYQSHTTTTHSKVTIVSLSQAKW